jgi:hypothetical protein
MLTPSETWRRKPFTMALAYLFRDYFSWNDVERRGTSIGQTDEHVEKVFSRVGLSLDIQEPNWFEPLARFDLNADTLCRICIRGEYIDTLRVAKG